MQGTESPSQQSKAVGRWQSNASQQTGGLMMTSHLPAQPPVGHAWWGGDGEHILPGTQYLVASWPGSPARQGLARPWKSTALEEGEALGSQTAAPSIRGCLQVSILSAASSERAVTVPMGCGESGAGSIDSAPTAQLTPLCLSSSPEALSGSRSPKSQKACGSFSPAAAECCAWESPNRLQPGQTGAPTHVTLHCWQ